MTRFGLFFENIQKDLKTYIFLLLLICSYRGYFIFSMQDYMGTIVGPSDIVLAMWAGFRISLKSAGAMALLSFLVCTVTNCVLPRLHMDRLRFILSCIYMFLLSVLFQARYPYYREFHATFNQNIFNSFKDDLYALFITMLQQYNLPLRLSFACLLTALLCIAYRYWIQTRILPMPKFRTKWSNSIFRLVVLLLIPVFMLFMRFGGSFNYTHSINWENAGITKDAFLNEVILDDIQALYRAHSTNKKMAMGEISGMHKEKIREYLKKIAGNDIESNHLEDYLVRKASGARIQKPRHIFIILGESYAQWPIMEKYAQLNVANGIKGLISQDNAYYTRAFMPNGSFTSMAVTGMVTGLSDINIYPNYQPETYKAPYATALAPQMKKLGYKTSFWYAGYPSWERIEEFSLAQGFDEFKGCPDYNAQPQNIWGTKDELLFDAIFAHLDKEPPTVHLILTSSNHPPYNLNLQEEGIDESAIWNAMSEESRKVEDLANELGHYKYMDRIVAEFVAKTYETYPDSLFIITGDHADRMNVTATPTLFERVSIPLVIYGQGITKRILPENVAGGHTSILPTLIELIAPKDFTYYSIADSMTNPDSKVGFNRDVWITVNGIGRIDSIEEEALPGKEVEDLSVERSTATEKIAMMRTISWWRLEKGNSLEGI